MRTAGVKPVLLGSRDHRLGPLATAPTTISVRGRNSALQVCPIGSRGCDSRFLSVVGVGDTDPGGASTKVAPRH